MDEGGCTHKQVKVYLTILCRTWRRTVTTATGNKEEEEKEEEVVRYIASRAP